MNGMTLGNGEWVIPKTQVMAHQPTRAILEKLNTPRVMHAPGECPDSAYGTNCDGIGHFGPDPFASEIYNDETPVWQCGGVNYGSAQDI